MKRYETPVVDVKDFEVSQSVMAIDDSSIWWLPPEEY